MGSSDNFDLDYDYKPDKNSYPYMTWVTNKKLPSAQPALEW